MDRISNDTPVSPLRQRMQDDMLIRGLGSHTRQDYIRHVRAFAAFLRRSPDTATADDIRRFQLHQHEDLSSKQQFLVCLSKNLLSMTYLIFLF